MNQDFLLFLNNLIQQALQQQNGGMPNYIDPMSQFQFRPEQSIITRSMQMNAPNRPVVGLGNTLSRPDPYAPAPGSTPIPYFPNDYGSVSTGQQPIPDGQYPGVDRNLDRRYPTNIGGIFPSTLVDYFAAPQPVRTFDNPNVNMPSRTLNTRTAIAPRIV